MPRSRKCKEALQSCTFIFLRVKMISTISLGDLHSVGELFSPPPPTMFTSLGSLRIFLPGSCYTSFLCSLERNFLSACLECDRGRKGRSVPRARRVRSAASLQTDETGGRESPRARKGFCGGASVSWPRGDPCVVVLLTTATHYG